MVAFCRGKCLSGLRWEPQVSLSISQHLSVSELGREEEEGEEEKKKNALSKKL